MTSSVLKPPNMDDCKPKGLCVDPSGVETVFAIDTPCYPGRNFDECNCTCEGDPDDPCSEFTQQDLVIIADPFNSPFSVTGLYQFNGGLSGQTRELYISYTAVSWPRFELTFNSLKYGGAIINIKDSYTGRTYFNNQTIGIEPGRGVCADEFTGLCGKTGCGIEGVLTVTLRDIGQSLDNRFDITRSWTSCPLLGGLDVCEGGVIQGCGQGDFQLFGRFEGVWSASCFNE